MILSIIALAVSIAGLIYVIIAEWKYQRMVDYYYKHQSAIANGTDEYWKQKYEK